MAKNWHSGADLVKGTISKALDLLAKGLAPFVARRLRVSMGEKWLERRAVAHGVTAVDPQSWDAHIVLLLMWDHWNPVFRHDLTHVERCLVSELREFRNCWAHQQDFTERDTYRCLDSIERLLISVKSPIAPAVGELRRESLQRLHDSELVESDSSGRDWFTAGVTAVCGVVLSIAVAVFFPVGFSWALACLILLVFGRLVVRMLQSTMVITTGPRQCSECTRVFYGDGCPYCERVQHIADTGFTPSSVTPSSVTPSSVTPSSVTPSSEMAVVER